MRRIILTALALVLVQGSMCPMQEIMKSVPPHTTNFMELVPPVPILIDTMHVTVTAYSSTPAQTDSTPFITASNTRVRDGIVAMSRDLLRRYTPDAPFAYGDSVQVLGRVYVVEDTMNRRWSRRIDIWFPDSLQALEFGKQYAVLEPAGKDRFK